MMNRFSCLLALCFIAIVPAVAHSQDLSDKIKAPMPGYSFTGSLSGALADLSRKGSVEIHVDWSLMQPAGVARETKVAIQAKDVTWEQALDLVLYKASPKDHPLAWYRDNNSIRVSLQESVVSGASQMRAPAAGPTTQPADAARPAEVAKAAAPTAARSGRGIDFNNTPLSTVLKYFQEAAKLNLVVNWNSLEAAGITKDTPVTLQVKGVSVGRALDLVLDQVSGKAADKFSRAYWILDKGVITVATGTAFNTETRTKVIDVADLLFVVPNFEAPRINLATNSGAGNNSGGFGGGIFNTGSNTGTNGSGDANDTNMAQKRAQARDSLVEMVKNSIGQDMWSPDGKGTITIFNNQLVISQTPLGWKLLEEVVGRP